MGVYISDSNGKLKKYSGLQKTENDGLSSDIAAINSILNKTEQVETIYDKDDPNKDWGYSGGLSSGTRVDGKDFSKYKYLKVYCYRWGRVDCGVIDLHQTGSDAYYGSTIIGTVESGTQYTSVYNYMVFTNKQTFYITGIWQNAIEKHESFFISKIEGVY